MNVLPDAVAAVTAADPYPCYARLRAMGPLHYDAMLKLWIASSSTAVDAVLEHPELFVRPAAEPVPRAIAGDASGAVFGRLARMNDGPLHQAARRALQSRLVAIGPAALSALAHRHARARVPHSRAALDEWIFRVPLLAVAEALGVAAPALDGVAAQVQDFVACLSPLSGPRRLAAAAVAARHLLDRFGEGVDAWAGHLPPELPRDVWVANLVGLLSQTCEATAGLLGNTIVALVREPGLLEAVQAQPSLRREAVDEVARHDAPVQNTRRFAHSEPVELLGRRIEPGQAVLVLLASANRDEAANPEPDAFRLRRDGRRHHGFGHGAHHCPGQVLALAVAEGALCALDEQIVDLGRDFPSRPAYRASVNARIPRFNPFEAG